MLTKDSPDTCLLLITGAFAAEGGIAVANRLVIHALKDAGYGLEILALTESAESFSSYAKYDNLAFEGFSGNKVPFTLKAWRKILQKRYRMIFCDHVNLASLLTPLAFLKLAKYTVRLNGIEVFPPMLNFEGRLGLQGAANRIAISEFTQQHVLEQFPQLNVKACDLSLPPNHQLPESSSPLTQNSLTAINGTLMPLKGKFILHVGRMASAEQYKGQDTLIQAMPSILLANPDAQLVLTGHGDDAARLTALAQALPTNVQSAIFMPGYVNEEMLSGLYANCYLFAMPSRGEGFGFVYIEAMQWRKPCIGSLVDAARDIIEDGVTGLLVTDPSDPAETAQQVTTLLNQPELARRMGEAGRKRVEVYFQYEHFKTRFLEALAS